jgi:hypothetical protein
MDATRINLQAQDDEIEQALEMFPATDLEAMRLVFKQAMEYVYVQAHNSGYIQALYDEGLAEVGQL